jgi:hypothetical protein
MGRVEGQNNGEDQGEEVVSGLCDFSLEEWGLLTVAEQEMTGMIYPLVVESGLRISGDKLAFLKEVHYALLAALQSENESLRAYAKSAQGLLADAVDRVKQTIDAQGLDLLTRELAFLKKRYPSCVSVVFSTEEGEEVIEETDAAAKGRLSEQLHRYVVLIKNATASGAKAAPDLVCQPALRTAFVRAWTMTEPLLNEEEQLAPWDYLIKIGYIGLLPNKTLFITPKGQQVYLPEMDE